MNETSRRRIFAVVAILVSAGVLAYLAFGGIGKNLVYYWSPSEMKQAGSKAVGATIRLGGLVAPGSLERGSDGLTLNFAVTDGENSVPVYAHTVPPAMFREGIGVVVEGTLEPDGVFQTDRLMVKHDNQYRAPGADDKRDVRELMKTMEPEGGNG